MCLGARIRFRWQIVVLYNTVTSFKHLGQIDQGNAFTNLKLWRSLKSLLLKSFACTTERQNGGKMVSKIRGRTNQTADEVHQNKKRTRISV